MINTTIPQEYQIKDFINSTELNLYIELGNLAAENGEEDEAKNWYSIGLQLSIKMKNKGFEIKFKRFLFSLL